MLKLQPGSNGALFLKNSCGKMRMIFQKKAGVEDGYSCHKNSDKISGKDTKPRPDSDESRRVDNWAP